MAYSTRRFMFGFIAFAALLLGLLLGQQQMPRANDVRANATGLWYNPDESGWGLSLTEQGSTTFAAYYTYDNAGEPTWLVMSACIATPDGCAGDIFEVVGGTPLGAPWSASRLSVTNVGVGKLIFTDSNTGRFDFTIRQLVGSKPIVRQSVAAGVTSPNSRANDTSGMWWNSAESGWGMTLTQQAGNVFSVIFTYDAAGKPIWYVASNCQIAADNCSGALFRTKGGRPPHSPWAGASITATNVGALDIGFTGNRLAAIRPTLNGATGQNILSRMDFLPVLNAEASIGAPLARPAFQCGSGVDSVTADVAPASVTVFESGPVRPIQLSADGQRLYVANAQANCLEIYAVEGDTLRLASSVAVGLEPVAVAERNGNEVWVVNHLSDSVSIVRLDGTPRVLRSLNVGDEPRDIVFAGTTKNRAFITTAARGQNKPGFSDADLVRAGAGRADVWVFDANALDDSINGNPLSILTLFADTPRALVTNRSGSTVYAAAFMSGNNTTALTATAAGNTKPTSTTRSTDGIVAPATGLIVRQDIATDGVKGAWRDETGRDWSSSVRFALPDNDVFAIDANANPPKMVAQISNVGTTLFNMALHPNTGQLYVSNTEAQNQIRFEGSGSKSSNSSVRGRLAESRISAVNVATGRVDPIHLNAHLDFSLPQGASLAASEKNRSLAQPNAMVFSPNGETLYVAALGSAKVAAIPSAQLSSSRFSPDTSTHISVPDGPAGLALNANGTRLYVYSHVAHKVSVIDTQRRSVLNSIALFSPESERVKSGRRVFYDANLSSANGSSSCASCHIFGNTDQLAWDLGNPDDGTSNNPNAYVTIAGFSLKTTLRFHPLKGPMSTQTLRGMTGNGPLHWRGDRTGLDRKMVGGKLESLEEAAFKEFNPAFISLLGREAPLSDADMQAFTDFAMALAVPPSSVRAIDNSLTPNQLSGRQVYFNRPTIVGGLATCNDCHRLNETNKQFGTSGLMSFEGTRIAENFKVPHLRNMVEKVGMFATTTTSGAGNGQAQIRGFGFAHDGASDTLDSFFRDPVFSFPAPAQTMRAQMVAFMFAMDTDLLPAVGQQVTWRPGANPSAGAAVDAKLAILKQQATTVSPRRSCDLIVRHARDGNSYSGVYIGNNQWLMKGGLTISEATLQQLAAVNAPLTYTCVVPGEGKRIALNLP